MKHTLTPAEIELIRDGLGLLKEVSIDSYSTIEFLRSIINHEARVTIQSVSIGKSGKRRTFKK